MRTVPYDADCGLCRFIMGNLLRLDRHRRLRPLPLQGTDAAGLLPGMDEETRMASFHVVDSAGAVRSGGRALPSVLRALPGGGPIAWLLESAQPLTDGLYRVIADNRTTIGPRIPERWRRSATRTIEERQAAFSSG